MILYLSITLNIALIALWLYREDTMRNRLRSKLAKQAEKFNESTNKWHALVNGATEDFEKVVSDLKKSRNELYDLYQAAIKDKATKEPQEPKAPKAQQVEAKAEKPKKELTEAQLEERRAKQRAYYKLKKKRERQREYSKRYYAKKRSEGGVK